MTIFERKLCPVCQSGQLEHFSHPAADPTWEVRRCQDCDFVFVANPPEVDFAAKQFPWEETMVNEKLRRDREHAPLVRGSRRVFARLKRATRSILRRDKVARLSSIHFADGPVLDIGCGDGSLLCSLPRACVPWGIDLSPALAAEASNRFAERGGKAVCDDALSGLRGFPDRFFTGVLARSFLEHEIRPLEVLHEIRRVLAPRGSVIIKVPNFASVNRLVRGDEWCGYRFPDHVNYFKPDNLKQLLKQAELEIERFGLKDRLPTSDNMWCVAKRPTR